MTKELNAEQREYVSQLLEKYSKKMVNQDIDYERFESAVHNMYALVDYPKPKVIYCDSHQALYDLVKHIDSINALREEEVNSVTQKVADKLSVTNEEAEALCQQYYDNLWVTDPPANKYTDIIRQEFEKTCLLFEGNQRAKRSISDSYFYKYWLQGSLAFAEAAEYLGVSVDKRAVELLRDFGQIVGFMMIFGNACFVSRNPTELYWQNDELHREDGPAIVYKDGCKLWALEGHLVDEQLVLHPETQTLEQINNELNVELKRIRINRYGWERYLTESEAQVLDTRVVTLPSGSTWMESVMQLVSSDEVITVLCTYDPSTGRPYTLEVDPEVITCEEAQRYLLSPDEALSGCTFYPNDSLPVLRT